MVRLKEEGANMITEMILYFNSTMVRLKDNEGTALGWRIIISIPLWFG